MEGSSKSRNILKNSLEGRDSWGVWGGSQKGRESYFILIEGNRWEMSKDKGGYVGRCYQLEGKQSEFD